MASAPVSATPVAGTVVQASAVASLPDTLYGSGTVVAIPETRGNELSARVGLHEPLLRHVGQPGAPRPEPEVYAGMAGGRLEVLVAEGPGYRLDILFGEGGAAGV